MDPLKPDYEGACVSNVVDELLGPRSADWLPEPVRDASSVVLLVCDGLGWTALDRHPDRVPTLRSLDGGPISTVVPSTTATGLTSITTGLPPAEHGMVGYRMHVGVGVLNVLRWKIPQGVDPPDPDRLQPHRPFGGRDVPVVTRAEFKETGFTKAHLRGGRFTGAHAVSDLVEHCRLLTDEGEPFVYAYYGGLDVVGHMHGLRDTFFSAELAFVDRLCRDLLEGLPPDAALAVVSDHGHLHFEEMLETPELDRFVASRSGEGRFRSFHARPGAADDLREAAAGAYGDRAWVFTRDELFSDGWLGPRPPAPEVVHRIGDVVLAGREPVFFVDPENRGEATMRSGHGSLTPDEMLVPLLAGRGQGAR